MISRIKEIVKSLTEKELTKINDRSVSNTAELKLCIKAIKELDSKLNKVVDEVIENSLDNSLEKTFGNLTKRFQKFENLIDKTNKRIDDMEVKFIDIDTSLEHVYLHDKDMRQLLQVDINMKKNADTYLDRIAEQKREINEQIYVIRQMHGQFRDALGIQCKAHITEMRAVINDISK